MHNPVGSVYNDFDGRPLNPMRFLTNYNSIMNASVAVGNAYGGQANSIWKTTIERLDRKSLTSPLDVFIETDEECFLARTPDLPLYGMGDSPVEAIDMLKREIESLYDDLVDGENFTDNWVPIKAFLEKKVLVSNEE
jgi:predicted RNase H-like HicB family nuclease